MARGWRWVAGIVASLGGLVVLVSTLGARTVSNRYSSDLAATVAKAKRLGMPVSFADIPMPSIPVEQNAGWAYQQAGNLTQSTLRTPNAVAERAATPAATYGDLVEGIVAIQELHPALRLVEESKGELCSFPHDWSQGYNERFTEFDGLKKAVRALCFKAEIQEDVGDWRSAFDSLRLAEHVSRDAGSDPVAISMLVRLSCEQMAFDAMFKIVKRERNNPEFLAELSQFAKDASSMPDPKWFFAGETAMVSEAFDQIRDLSVGLGEDSKNRDLATAFISNVPGARDEAKAMVLKAWEVAWERFPKDPNDWDQTSAALKAMQDYTAADQSAMKVVYNLTGDYGNAADDVFQTEAKRRMLATAAAILEVHLKTGRYPLALPPGSDFIDPFDSRHQSLKYRLQGPGFILYSIGPDRTDDGGKPRDPNMDQDAHYDIVFQLH